MLDQGRTLLELADEIDSVLHTLQNENNAIHHYELLYRQLSFYELLPNDLNYQVYQKEKIIAPYLLTYWILCSRGIDNHNMLQSISRKIRKIFMPSTNVGINESAVHQLMRHIEQRFGYCTKVLKDKPLKIIITEDAYKNGNSLFMTHSIENKEYKDQRDLVILSRRINENVAPEFAFLHELGHILHVRITQQYADFLPPKSFDMILNKMFRGYDGKENRLKAELFAECFAVAALYDSEYSHYDHLSYISNANRLLIYIYFSSLMVSYEKIKSEDCTWDEMFELSGLKSMLQNFI